MINQRKLLTIFSNKLILSKKVFFLKLVQETENSMKNYSAFIDLSEI